MRISAKQRVANGIAFITKLHRGSKAWLKKIDLDRLNIRSGDDCIVGQIYDGDFWNNVIEKLNLTRGHYQELQNLGLLGEQLCNMSRFDKSCKTLTKEWKLQIKREIKQLAA